MIDVLSYGLWNKVSKISRRSTRRACAIAYVSNADIIKFTRGDSLIVDASDESIKCGRTSARILKKLYGSGVELWSNPQLHAKILLLDDISIVSSANLSNHSKKYLYETAIVTDRPDVAGQLERILADLKTVSTQIDSNFIKRIVRLPVTIRPMFGRSKAVRSIKQHQRPRSWLINIYDAKYHGNEKEINKVSKSVRETVNPRENKVDWFFWPEGYSFSKLVRVGDSIVEIFRENAGSKSARGVTVYRHGRILKIFKEKGVRHITYHCAWPKDFEETSLNWVQFTKLAQRAGVKRQLSPASVRVLTESQSNVLYEIWPKSRN